MIFVLAWLAAAGPSYAIEAARPEGLWLATKLGAGSVAGDVVAVGAVGAGVETAPFGLHVEVPLTLRLVDLPPEVGPPAPSSCRILRCEEWSEHGTISLHGLARVVEELRVFRPGDVFHARGGRLFATLGRGQHVARYTNAADWDRRGAGVYVEGNIPWGRSKLEALVGRALTPQDLMAARVSSSVLDAHAGADDVARLLGRMRLGLEGAADTSSRPIAAAAVDVGWPLLDDTEGVGLQIEPWVSLSAMSGLLDRSLPQGGSAGIGGGGSAGLEVTVDAIFVALRASLRGTLDGARHRSAVFSTLYDVDRQRVLASTGTYAATGTADLAATGGAGGGGALEIVVLRAARAGARLHLDPIAEASELEGFAEVSLGPVFIGVRGLQRALRSPIDVIAFGDRTFLVAEFAWSVWPPLSLFVRWRHAPRFDGTQVRTNDDVVAGASMDLLLR